MTLTHHEVWGVIHGMGFGALFLLAFAGGLAGLYSLRPALVTAEGVPGGLRDEPAFVSSLEAGNRAVAQVWNGVEGARRLDRSDSGNARGFHRLLLRRKSDP